MKGSVWSLVLKQGHKVTWEWPITPPNFFPLASSAKRSLIFCSRNVRFALHWISDLIKYSSFTLRSDWLLRCTCKNSKLSKSQPERPQGVTSSLWHVLAWISEVSKKGKIWAISREKRLFYQSEIIFTHLVPLFTSSLSLLFQELPVQSPPLWWVQTTRGIGEGNTEVQETWRQLAKARETRRLGTRTEGLVNQLWTKVLRLCLILILRLKRQWLMLQWGKLLITSIC